jgi:hypothetical protein
VQLTLCSTLTIQQATPYSIICCKAKKEIDFLQDGGKMKKGKKFDHHGLISTGIQNIFHLPDPPTFSSVPTVKILTHIMEIIFYIYNRHGFEMCIITKNFAEQGPSKFFESFKNVVLVLIWF